MASQKKTFPARPSIKNWDIDDRPREKLISRGASSLSDEELLGILIGSGTREHSAVSIGSRLLENSGNSLTQLGRCDIPQLMKMPGIGSARAVVIAAALELGRRRKAEDIPQDEHISTSLDVVNIFRPLLSDLPHEEVWAVLLTNSKRVIERFRLSQGGVGASPFDTRLLLKRAVERLAAAMVIVHNHPSGDPSPSEMDIMNTRKVKAAASYFDIRLLDHVIIADRESFSFLENKLL